MYIYLIEVDLLSQVFCTLQTNAIAIDTLYIFRCFFLCLSLPDTLLPSFVKENGYVNEVWGIMSKC